VISLSFNLQAQEEVYLHIAEDLSRGLKLQDVLDRAYDNAGEVTGQLDFKPNETLVVRRMGGEMALNCRAQSYAYVLNFPPVPIVRYPDPLPPPPPGDDDVASPN